MSADLDISQLCSAIRFRTIIAPICGSRATIRRLVCGENCRAIRARVAELFLAVSGQYEVEDGPVEREPLLELGAGHG